MSPTAQLAPEQRTDDETWELVDVEDETPPAAHRPSPLEFFQLGRDAQREQVRVRFDLLADELAVSMAGASSTRRAMRHPAYAEILALGKDAIPFLLRRLERPGSRPLWLRLLGSLTAFQPGAGQETISDAAHAWMRWGRTEGFPLT